MFFKYDFLLFIMFFISPCCEAFYDKNKLIIVMGASCSGKSTLSKKLLQSLGRGWRFVELDEIEDEFKLKNITITDDDLINAVVNCANENLANGYNVIIDTNMYDHKFIDVCCDNKVFVLVYCPLKVLLERNAVRDRKLQRNAQRAYYAQEYVLKTFYSFENHEFYDLKINTSLLSIDESVEKVITFISD